MLNIARETSSEGSAPGTVERSIEFEVEGKTVEVRATRTNDEVVVEAYHNGKIVEGFVSTAITDINAADIKTRGLDSDVVGTELRGSAARLIDNVTNGRIKLQEG